MCIRDSINVGVSVQLELEGQFTDAERPKVMDLSAALNMQHAKLANPADTPILPLRMVSASCEIEFYLVDPETDERIGEPIIRGEDIWSVEANKKPDNSTDILINLNRAAGAKLLEVTSKNIGKRMAIVFEGKQLSAHTIHAACLLYTSPSPRDLSTSRMPSSA